MNETLDVASGQSGLRVGLERINRREPGAKGEDDCLLLRGSQGFICIQTLDLAFDTAGAAGSAKITAVFGLCACRARPPERVAHGCERQGKSNGGIEQSKKRREIPGGSKISVCGLVSMQCVQCPPRLPAYILTSRIPKED